MVEMEQEKDWPEDLSLLFNLKHLVMAPTQGSSSST